MCPPRLTQFGKSFIALEESVRFRRVNIGSVELGLSFEIEEKHRLVHSPGQNHQIVVVEVVVEISERNDSVFVPEAPEFPVEVEQWKCLLVQPLVEFAVPPDPFGLKKCGFH